MAGIAGGEGWSAASLDDLGAGPGFRKIRSALGVTAFGANALVLPAGFAGHHHFHDEQEELYFVHAGELEFSFGDGSTQRLGPGGLVRVSPATARGYRVVGDEDAVLLCFGGKDGYVGRDAHVAGDGPVVSPTPSAG